MKNICLCFQVHHPFHFQAFRFTDIDSNKSYYDDLRIEREINDAVTNYYSPSNDFLLKLIKKHPGKLKMAFYISGTASDQFLLYEPHVLTSFRELAHTGQVDFLGSTSSHSLVTLTNHKKELVHQIKDHQTKTEYLFGIKPQVFVNSDLIYSDLIGKDIAEAGYRAMITNGSKKTLVWRSPNYVYSNSHQPKMDIYFRNEQLSDELELELSRLDSPEKEDNPHNFLSFINNHHNDEPLVNIYIDYKALGGVEIEKKQQFIESMVSQIIESSNVEFVTPSEIAERLGSVAPILANEPICWVNNFHSYYYPGNELQTEALKQLYLLQNTATRIDMDINLQKDWQYLQTSDHIHLMDDQHPTYLDGNIAESLFKTKYDAFINYMNILDDFRLKLYKETGKREKKRTRRQVQNKNSH
ncbi:MAG TPA: alpha-amylase [Prolixibacteraceae bacterium]|jgi:alpha-amylase|nr:alpha-amylase [Prolixibacteraceae bacterium]